MTPRRFDVPIEYLDIGGIPTIAVGEKRARAVIHHHGSEASKESDLQIALRLADAGYQVFLPDAPLHGERLPVKKAPILEVLAAVFSTAETETKILADRIRAQGAEEISISGKSMGGIRAFLAAVTVQPARLSILVSGGDFDLLLRETANFALASARANGLLRAAFVRTAKRFDPLTVADHLPPMPVYLAGGACDDVVPIECARALARVLEQRDNFTYREYADAGHAPSEEMIADYVEWYTL